jgi:Zn-dependent protease with chaperone function
VPLFSALSRFLSKAIERKDMNDLVYPRERTLGTITLVIGALVWLGLIVGAFGAALLVLAAGCVLVLLAQSALGAHVKRNGAELSEARLPDLHAQFTACCERLQMKTPPKAYILNGNGGLNAFATSFPGARFVVLKSGVVGAMDKQVDGVRFYIGHELGRLRMQHLGGALLRWPAMWLPLLGAAYSRARETTCDRHGLACSGSPKGAARALAALSAGSQRWKNPGLSSGLWMSFHELTAGCSRLSRRVARMTNTEASMPRRDRLAYLLAMLVPYTGRLGAGFSVLVMVYIVDVLAAAAIPTYLDSTVKAKVSAAVVDSQPVRNALARHYQATEWAPKSLAEAGIPSHLTDGTPLSLDPKAMVLTVGLKEGEVVFTPGVDAAGRITWECKNGKGIKPTQLPSNCSEMTIGSN